MALRVRVTHRITPESRPPTSVDASEALCPSNLAPCFEIALVHLWVDLTTAFDEI
jgi:hypothetical protein